MPSFYWEVRGEAHLSFFVTANVPDFNHHKGTENIKNFKPFVTTNVPDFNHHKNTKNTKNFKAFSFLRAFVASCLRGFEPGYLSRNKLFLSFCLCGFVS